MKVYVKLFSTLMRSVPDTLRASYPQIRSGVPLTVELPQAATLNLLMDTLRVPRQEAKVIFVNGRAREPDYPLSDGDEVGIFPAVGGG